MMVGSGRIAVLVTLAIAGSGLATAAWLEPRIREERHDLRLDPPVPDSVPEELRGEAASPTVALVGASLGVFRPIALDFLWLRSLRLQREGRFFEAVALARFITTLQPRVAGAWTFQAHNLAYNIAGEVSPGERPDWVERGIRLLLDDGLPTNPTSPRLYAQLSVMFLHKIGLDHDPAHPLLKQALAAAFEPPADLEGDRREEWLRTRLREWKLDLERLRSRVATASSPTPLSPSSSLPGSAALDARSAHLHALYWAGIGAPFAVERGDRFASFLLRRYRALALEGLVSGGLVVRTPVSRWHAYLPAPEWASELVRVAEAEVLRYADRPVLAAEARDGLRASIARVVCSLALRDRWEDARRWAGRIPDIAPGGVEEILLGTLADEDAPEASPEETGSVRGAAPLTRQIALERLAWLCRVAICLELSEEPGARDARAGFLRLAGLLHQSSERLLPEASLPSPGRLAAGLRAGFARRLRTRASTAHLAERLEPSEPGAEPATQDPADSLWESPSPPYYANLCLELLDPLAAPEVAP